MEYEKPSPRARESIDLHRLKKALIDATGPGKRFTRRGLSLKVSNGKNPDVVRDILSGKSKNPEADTLVGLARELGVPLSEFIVMGATAPGGAAEKWLIQVEGEVAAGVFRPQTDWPAYQKYEIEVGPPPIPNAERYGVRMVGYSMDQVIPPGSDLEILRLPAPTGAIEPQSGDIVIVEKRAHDLVELTCKRLDKEDGQWVLRFESTKPEFQEMVILGRADRELVTDEEIEIVGIVLSSQQQLFRRR